MAEAAPGKRLPPLLFVTDPARVGDPAEVAGRLPPGAGVVFRHFGSPDAPAEARRLRAVTRDRGQVLLIGRDVGLARSCGADGVHLPEAEIGRIPEVRSAGLGLVTVAAHGPEALATAARAGADAALLSPLFASASPSAGVPIGLDRFAALVAETSVPVYALGGVNASNASGLIGSGAAGLAAIDGVLEAWPPAAQQKSR